jgi:hypothetical protein
VARLIALGAARCPVAAPSAEAALASQQAFLAKAIYRAEAWLHRPPC